MQKRIKLKRQVYKWKLFVLFLFVLWPLTAAARESPLALVRQTTEQAVTVLQNPALQGKGHEQERTNRFWEAVIPEFDAQEVAKRALSIHWQKLSEEQKNEFVPLFIELIKHSYRGTLERYTANAQFFFDHERIEGKEAEVNTRILAPDSGKTFAVNYRLHQVGDKWLIYDVVAENISLVQNYRTQFNRILQDSSYDKLVQTLRKKVQEVQA